LDVINPSVSKDFQDLNKNNVFLVDADVVLTQQAALRQASSSLSTPKRGNASHLCIGIRKPGLAVTTDKGVNFDKLKKFTDKMKPINQRHN